MAMDATHAVNVCKVCAVICQKCEQECSMFRGRPLQEVRDRMPYLRERV
jgi:hypothetical protein